MEQIQQKLGSASAHCCGGQNLDLDHEISSDNDTFVSEYQIKSDLRLVKEVLLFLFILPSPARGFLVLPEVGENVHQVVLGR